MIPAPSDPRWQMIVTGRRPLHPTYLALRLLMQRVTMKTRTDKSPATVQALSRELYSFCVKYESLLGSDLDDITR